MDHHRQPRLPPELDDVSQQVSTRQNKARSRFDDIVEPQLKVASACKAAMLLTRVIGGEQGEEIEAIKFAGDATQVAHRTNPEHARYHLKDAPTS